MNLNPISRNALNPQLLTESKSVQPNPVPRNFDSKFEECIWTSDCCSFTEVNLPRIPGINLYLADAAYEVLIENGVFPAVSYESDEAQD